MSLMNISGTKNGEKLVVIFCSQMDLGKTSDVSQMLDFTVGPRITLPTVPEKYVVMRITTYKH